MATVDKNFRVKNGLVVEGTTGTIDGNNIVTDADTTDILSEGTVNLYFTDQRAVDAVAGELDTDGISEGTTNLYFTDERVQDVLVSAVQENIAITSTDGILYITAENGVADSTTDELDEGTVNLYFTDQRAIDAVAGGEGFTTDVVEEGTVNLYFTDQRAVDAVIDGSVDTDDIEEGTTNLYYTDARVEDVIAASDTDDLSEGTINLYYTDERSRSAISGSTGITYSSTDGVIYVDTDEIASKSYVDELIQGLDVKESVLTASTVNFDITTNASGGIGGYVLGNGERVLLKNQTNIAENGIYVYSSATQTIIASTDPADTDLNQGAYVLVEKGTNAATGWVVTDTTGGGDTWSQFSAANEYTAGTGISIDANAISINADTDEIAEGTINLYFTDQRAVDAVIDGSVDTDDIEEGTVNLYFTSQRAIDAVIDGSVDTDDIEEGTVNLYYTDARVGDVIAAIDTDDISEGTTNLYYTTQKVYDDLVNSVQENISITTTDGMLYITAENGVADATTDDLDEGTTNLYFTDQRAVDAIEAVVPDFTEIEINSVSKQIAATVNVANAETPTVVYSFDTAEYRSAKFIVKAASGSHTEISEVLITLDTSDNVAITEYAIVSTNGNLIDVTAVETTGDVTIVVEAVNADTDVTVFGTLIA
jgi:esterase/lipase superfamily enzyme